MHRHSQRGVISVEAAFAFPSIIMLAMIAFEFVNVVLTIDMGDVALQSAVQQARLEETLTEDSFESVVRKGIVTLSHGYLTQDNITNVDVRRYSSLSTLRSTGEEEDADSANEKGTKGTTFPAWKVTVDIRKPFLTPLPRLMAYTENEFEYRFEQVLGYLPETKDQ
ncbi:MAG: pilus assembly protein [Desulfovibrio sp.]|uniref:TadE/TadG family type IV pilus assembly protein n=1 Tax=Desulfovibrio sp. TaxID=885 RepID=UPI0039E456C9